MKSRRKKILTTKALTMTAVFAALSFALFLLEFPIPFFPPYLQFDFSDVPALIGAFMFGPLFGVAIELFKNALHLMVPTKALLFGIGELANFVIGCGLVVPAGLIYKYKRSFKGALIGLIAGTLCIAIAGIAFNYFVMIPLQIPNILPIDNITIVLSSILPFNLLKGAVVSIVTLVLYKQLKKLIDRMFRNSEKVKLISTELPDETVV